MTAIQDQVILVTGSTDWKQTAHDLASVEPSCSARTAVSTLQEIYAATGNNNWNIIWRTSRRLLCGVWQQKCKPSTTI